MRDAKTGLSPVVPEVPSLEIGMVIGSYKLIRAIGHGGMGDVYLAEENGLDRRVAIKTIRGEADEAAMSRFLAEGRALAKIKHENVISIYTVGNHFGTPYMAMEYVEGWRPRRTLNLTRGAQRSDRTSCKSQARRSGQQVQEAVASEFGAIGSEVNLTTLEMWELGSYVVTVVGLPFALVVFMLEQKKERENEDEEIYQKLSDEYAEFSVLLLRNSDLQLMSTYIPDEQLAPDQRERKTIIFDILVSLFERAFILVYEDNMNAKTRRLWSSWEDYIGFWMKRPDFRAALDHLLEGEDPDFQNYMRQLNAARASKL